MATDSEPRDRHIDNFSYQVDRLRERLRSRPQTSYGWREGDKEITREEAIITLLEAQVRVNTMLSDAISKLEQEVREEPEDKPSGNIAT